MTLMLQNRALLEAFRAGDPAALRRVYDEYVGEVERAALRGFRSSDGDITVRVRSADQLADVVQEVFVRVFSPKTRNSYDGLREFRAFLMTVARNVIADHFRKQSKEIALSDSSVVKQEDSEPPDPWLDPGLVRIAELYVADLPLDLKQVHQARFVAGMSQGDAAKQIGSTRQRVRTLEQRLRDGLRRLVEISPTNFVAGANTPTTGPNAKAR